MRRESDSPYPHLVKICAENRKNTAQLSHKKEFGNRNQPPPLKREVALLSSRMSSIILTPQRYLLSINNFDILILVCNNKTLYETQSLAPLA